MRAGWWITGAGAMSAATLAAQVPPAADQRQRLIQAKADSAAAARRADALQRDAASEQTAAARARAQQRIAATRVAEAQADLEIGEAQVALADRRLAERRTALAIGEAPTARLLGALASLGRRPAIAAVAQPGSVDDLVHLRAIFDAVRPAIRARTAALRVDLAGTRTLRDTAARAASALAGARATLERRRAALALAEADHGARAQVLGRTAMAESDRAIALGEYARDIVDQIGLAGGQRATRAELETLPGPLAPTRPGGATRPAYRLPVAGALVSGFGELSAAGVRARGLTFAAAAGAPVRAPAGGRVIFARAFRDYGPIVVIDHGAGWTSLVTGLSRVSVRAGEAVAAEARIGAATTGEDPRVTVELRRQGRPVNPAALL